MDEREFIILKLYHDLREIPWHELRDKHTVGVDFMNWATNKDDVQMVVAGIQKKLIDYEFIEAIPRTIKINPTSKITDSGDAAYYVYLTKNDRIKLSPLQFKIIDYFIEQYKDKDLDSGHFISIYETVNRYKSYVNTVEDFDIDKETKSISIYFGAKGFANITPQNSEDGSGLIAEKGMILLHCGSLENYLISELKHEKQPPIHQKIENKTYNNSPIVEGDYYHSGDKSQITVDKSINSGGQMHKIMNANTGFQPLDNALNHPTEHTKTNTIDKENSKSRSIVEWLSWVVGICAGIVVIIYSLWEYLHKK